MLSGLSDEADDVVTYIEEGLDSAAPPPAWRPVADRELTRRDSLGPGRNIFGSTPEAEGGSHRSLKQHCDADFENVSFEIDEYSSQGSTGGAAVMTGLSLERPPRPLPARTPDTSQQIRIGTASSGERRTRALLTPSSGGLASVRRGGMNGSASKAPLHSQQLDRPAHWSSSSSSLKTIASGRAKRPLPPVRNGTARGRDASYSQPVYPAAFSTLKKRRVESPAPNSLDRVSFKPSWLRAEGGTPSLLRSTPTNHRKDDIEADWEREDTGPFQVKASDRYLHAMGGAGHYDRIDDISNSLNPGGDEGHTNTPAPLAIGQPKSTAGAMSPTKHAAYRDDHCDTPVKATNAKKKLKRFGALMKKVMRGADATETRWRNLNTAKELHRNRDPPRYDLTDPRCAATRCIDCTVVNSVDDGFLKLHYGLELLTLKVGQFCERKSTSVTFERSYPQHLIFPGLCATEKDWDESHHEVDVNTSSDTLKERMIRPQDLVVGLFRSNTIQSLKVANGDTPLKNVEVRIYDYIAISPNENSASDAYEGAMDRLRCCARLISTNIVEIIDRSSCNSVST